MPPQLDQRIKGREGFGLIQVVTGDGKGKTTSALGQVMRAVGAGKKATIIFFDKGGKHYSERAVLDTLGVQYLAIGRDRIDQQTGRFDFSVIPFDLEEASRGLAAARILFANNDHDLVVLDEINSCIHLGMLKVEDVLATLDEKPESMEVVLTGRNAPEALRDRAHLVTEAKLVKHYFYSGVPAREGLDF